MDIEVGNKVSIILNESMEDGCLLKEYNDIKKACFGIVVDYKSEDAFPYKVNLYDKISNLIGVFEGEPTVSLFTREELELYRNNNEI